MADNIPATLRQRLRAMTFSASEARDAIRGVAVPDTLGRRVMRLCVIRGIRYHEEFAQSRQAQALRAWPEFARALNARAIMSNSVPDMARDDDVPYCIWHPDTATEDTYRELVRRYPRMAYQVARACAVAGYSELYRELEAGGSILPDVAVAEEARACGSQDIYTAITSQPVRYRVMDDYSRSILAYPQPSGLNGDTATRPMLDAKQKFTIPRGDEDRVLGAGDCDGDQDFEDGDGSDDDFFSMIPGPGFKETMFNITEDMNIDEFATPEPDDAADLAVAEYLAKPLPPDLPMGNKDILILAAAYTGNVDRYARLRRPQMVDQEAGCVVRGIYHCPFFATWWATQTLLPRPCRHAAWIAQAIHARMIMSNDLSRLTPDVPRDHLPYLIWYPAVAQPSTYKEVARRCPTMRPAVLRAAIYAKDRTLFDELLDDVEPDPHLVGEARAHDHDHDDEEDEDEVRPSYFTRRLLARAEKLGLADEMGNALSDRWGGADSWKRFSVRSGGGGPHGMPESGNWLFGGPSIVGAVQDPGIYNGVWADASIAELFASAPESWRPKKDGGEGVVQIDYEQWPQ
ncbi:hypothetical protein BBAD15_g5206 [Beauveria bassiana D1-5]|uniref:Uncharacterized protein n=1 Tax=Beauveria bassiana D1-5 TaxID=1245745 RepID=A0A0A2W902_BEABA|nr:hypothetical protein BBAD15_g5206 [Beauveria bassiana D1-5]